MFLIITNKLCNLPRWVVHYLSALRPRSVHVHKVIVVIVSVRSGGVKEAENLSFGEGEGEKLRPVHRFFNFLLLFFSLSLSLSKSLNTFSLETWRFAKLNSSNQNNCNRQQHDDCIELWRKLRFFSYVFLNSRRIIMDRKVCRTRSIDYDPWKWSDESYMGREFNSLLRNIITDPRGLPITSERSVC